MENRGVSRSFVVNVLQNSIFVDLDNENDSFVYDDKGVRHSAVVTSQASLYDGHTVVSSGVTWSITESSGVTLMNGGAATNTNYSEGSYPSAAWIKPSGLVTVNGMTNGSMSGHVKVCATYNGNTYFQTLTLKKLVNADKYEIITIPTAIAYNITANAPSSTTVTVNIYRTDVGGTRTQLTSLPDGFSLTAYKGTSSSTATISHSSGSTNWTFPTENGTYDSYRVVLTGSGSVVHDSETIPITKALDGVDGIDGEDAAVAYLSPNPVLFNASSSGTVTSGSWREFVVQMTVNGNACTLSSITSITVTGMTNIIVASSSGGGAITSVSNINATSKTLYVRAKADTSSANGRITMLITGTYNNKTYTAYGSLSVNAVFAGKTGLMFYMMGEWNSATTYTRTSELIPLVHYDNGVWNENLGSNGHYWYLKADSSTNNTPAAGSTYWQQCDDFGVVITQGLFAKFAKLGSFVISDDWMYSQYGYIINSSGVATEVSSPSQTFDNRPAYTWFNSADPQAQVTPSGQGSDKYRFRPTFAVDGLTGQTYQNLSYTKGGICVPLLEITNSNIGDYSDYQTTTGRRVINKIPSNVGGFNFKMNTGVILQVPEPTSSMEGREFEILNTTDYSSASIILQTSNIINLGSAKTMVKNSYVKLKVVRDNNNNWGWFCVAIMGI